MANLHNNVSFNKSTCNLLVPLAQVIPILCIRNRTIALCSTAATSALYRKHFE